MVALLSPAAELSALPAGADLVRVNSGYEAAAEMLAVPAGALVVDLARITPTHLPLLALARKLAVPVVGFGTVSASLGPEDLANLKLSSRDAAGEAIAAALRTHAGGGDAAQKAPAPRPAAAPQPPRRPAETLTQAELDALLG